MRTLRPPLFHHSCALQFAHFFSPSLYFLLTSQNTCCLGQLIAFCSWAWCFDFLCIIIHCCGLHISQSTFTLNPLLFPYNNIHMSWIFAWKIKLALCFDIVQNSPTKHFLTIPFHIVVNHGYNTRLCDIHHGMYDIVSNCGLDIQFTCPSSLFGFELCCHGSFHCPSKCKIYVVCSYNQWFFNGFFSKCFVAKIKVLGETKKHNLVFQVPIHRIQRWLMGG